jgi:hypothetical protein
MYRNWLCKCCQDLNAVLVRVEKRCRWEAAGEWAAAARSAEESKEVAHASGGKFVMPKPSSRFGSRSCS